jgi:N-acetylglucosamine kinase-like BadF-type ATPase
MILITDGGSTKCDWILLDQKGDVVLKTRTKGLNPAVVPEENIRERILANQDFLGLVAEPKPLLGYLPEYFQKYFH